MDALKQARKSAERPIAQRAIGRSAALFALTPDDEKRIAQVLAQVDAAAEALDAAARLKSWVEANDYFGIKPEDRTSVSASTMMGKVLEYFDKSGSNPKVALSHIAANYGEDYKVTAARVRRLRAAVTDLNALHAEGYVSADELATLTGSLDRILYGLDARAGRPANPALNRGRWLMSLMRAVGYGAKGHKYRDAPEYTAQAAADLVLEILHILYGKEVKVTAQQLQNKATRPQDEAAGK